MYASLYCNNIHVDMVVKGEVTLIIRTVTSDSGSDNGQIRSHQNRV